MRKRICYIHVRPFSKETLRCGVIPEFLQSIGIGSDQFRDRGAS
jgi:hypothetical protein